MAFYQLRGDLLLPTRDLNHKFVMHLQDHAGPEPLLLQGAGNADHRDLDQVRSRPLEGGVGGGPLAKRPNVVVAVLELRYVAPPSEQCLDIPPLARLGDGAIEPGPDPGEAGEVLLDESRSEEHTSELQSLRHLVCRRLLEKKNQRQRSWGDD